MFGRVSHSPVEEVNWVTRFNVSERVEHALIMAAFLALMFTGLPQRFPEADASRWLILHLGGIETTRLIHRLFALVFILEGLYHVGLFLYGAILRNRQPGMIPSAKDVSDAVAMIRYSLRLGGRKPMFGRFTFRQKYEYWGVIFGGIIMITTGIMLAYPVFFTRVLPGVFVPIAKEIHGWEALLALSIIVIWHLYGIHLSPGNFPFDATIFSGRISQE